MKTGTVIALATVGVVAFAAGRLTMTPTAIAEPVQEELKAKAKAQAQVQEMELDPEMAAWMEAGQPGEHHKNMEQLIGEWDANVTIWMKPGDPPMTSTGTVSREWALDGRYVMEHVQASSSFGDFEGMGCLAYDNIDGHYEMAWIDSHSTGIYFETGTYDPSTKVMTFTAQHRGPDGKVLHNRGTFDLSSADQHHYIGYTTDKDGKEFKHFEGEFTRRK